MSVDIIPGKCSGKPCIAGTRFPLTRLLAELAERPPEQDLESIANDFDIDIDAARAALHWAAKVFDRSWVAGDGESRSANLADRFRLVSYIVNLYQEMGETRDRGIQRALAIMDGNPAIALVIGVREAIEAALAERDRGTGGPR